MDYTFPGPMAFYFQSLFFFSRKVLFFFRFLFGVFTLSLFWQENEQNNGGVGSVRFLLIFVIGEDTKDTLDMF